MADSDNDCSDGKPFAVETNHSYDVKRGRRVSPRESVRTKRKPTEHESDVSPSEDDESEDDESDDDDRCSERSSGGDPCAVEINQVCEVMPGRRVSPRESVRKKRKPTEHESDVWPNGDDDGSCSSRSSDGSSFAVEDSQAHTISPGCRVSPRESVRRCPR